MQFANLLLQLNWVGDSDYRNSEFIEYQGDSLGFTSEVLESFEAYYLNNKGDTIPIIVNSGINITIDSIHRNSKTVRISYKDFPVYTEIENIKDKITTNTAG